MLAVSTKPKQEEPKVYSNGNNNGRNINIYQFWVAVLLLVASGGVTWGIIITRLGTLETEMSRVRAQNDLAQIQREQILTRLVTIETTLDRFPKSIWDVRTRTEARGNGQ